MFESSSDEIRALGDNGVAKTSQAVGDVCPIGNPINHSIHRGFSFPLVWPAHILNMTCFPFAIRRCIAGFERLPRSRLSEAQGVGQDRLRAATVRLSLFLFHSEGHPLSFAMWEIGVGHSSPSVAASVVAVR